jgi:hypothetical protein
MHQIERPTFTATFIKTSIFLSGPVGYQIFATKRDLPSEPEHLHYALKAEFMSKADVEKSAQLYTEGHTNKDRFKEGVEGLLNAKKITEHDRNKLRLFINNCDCVPAKIRKKMGVIGYGHLTDLLDFADKDPRLTTTVDLFWEEVMQGMLGR